MGEVEEQRRPCPHCAEQILVAAKVCRFCNRPVDKAALAKVKPEKDDNLVIYLAVGAVLLLIVWILNLGEGGDTAASPSASNYRTMCATAYVAAKRQNPRLEPMNVAPTDPAILSNGPPVRIQCALSASNGSIGVVTADVHCTDPLEGSCVTPVSSNTNERVWLAPGATP